VRFAVAQERHDMEHIAGTLLRLYALVGGIWAVAEDQLTQMLKDALGSVSKG